MVILSPPLAHTRAHVYTHDTDVKPGRCLLKCSICFKVTQLSLLFSNILTKNSLKRYCEKKPFLFYFFDDDDCSHINSFYEFKILIFNVFCMYIF